MIVAAVAALAWAYLLLAHGLALSGTGTTRWIAPVTWAASAASYLPTLHRFRLSPHWALALPAIACFYGAATLGSALEHHRGRGVVWKRRACTGEETA